MVPAPFPPLRTLVRLILTGLLAIAVTLPSAQIPAWAGATEAHEVPLRIATYNIHAGIGADGDFDLARTAAAIRATGADVVGLQEVDVHWGARSQWRDEVRELAGALGMRAFFGHIYRLDPPSPSRPPREYGLAILSRYPIIDAENHEITRLSSQSPDPEAKPAPGFPEAVINVRGARVHVYNTHLDYRGDPAVRRMQVADMLAIMDEDRPSDRQVLLGDFNANPESPELAPLWRHLADAWDARQPARKGYTFPATDPVKRIDYITVSPDIEVRSVGVVETAAATPASDHLPVVAELALRRGH